MPTFQSFLSHPKQLFGIQDTIIKCQLMFSVFPITTYTPAKWYDLKYSN